MAPAVTRSLPLRVSLPQCRTRRKHMIVPVSLPAHQVLLLGDRFTSRLRFHHVKSQRRVACAHGISFDANMNLVTVYSDANCNNDAQAASLGGTCTTFPFTVQSYSVDCVSVNSNMGDIEASVSDGTNESETNAQTPTPSTEQTSLSTGAFSMGTSTTLATMILPSSSATSPLPQESTQPTSTPSTFTTKTSTLSPMPITTNNNLMNNVSPPAAATTHSSHAPSSSATNTSSSSNNNSNTNLSRNGEIVVGVVIPGVSIIVTILICIDQRRRHQKGDTNMANIIDMLRNYRHGSVRAYAPVFEVAPRAATRGPDMEEGRPF